MIYRITSSAHLQALIVALAILIGLVQIYVVSLVNDPFLILGGCSVVGLLFAGVCASGLKLYEIYRLHTQKNIRHRKYIESRLSMFMQNKIDYRAVCPYSDEKARITATTTLFRKRTFIITFVNEEYVCAGESNGNIHERRVVAYTLSPHDADIQVSKASSQIYADQTEHSSSPPVHETLRYLPDDLFARIEEILISWERSTVDI